MTRRMGDPAHQPVASGIGEQMLHPRPAFADGVENGLRANAVGGRQIDRQQPPIGIDRDMALAADNLLVRVVTPCSRLRSLD